MRDSEREKGPGMQGARAVHGVCRGVSNQVDSLYSKLDICVLREMSFFCERIQPARTAERQRETGERVDISFLV